MLQKKEKSSLEALLRFNELLAVLLLEYIIYSAVFILYFSPKQYCMKFYKPISFFSIVT